MNQTNLNKIAHVKCRAVTVIDFLCIAQFGQSQIWTPCPNTNLQKRKSHTEAEFNSILHNQSTLAKFLSLLKLFFQDSVESMVCNAQYILTLHGNLTKYFKINHYIHFKEILSIGQNIFLKLSLLDCRFAFRCFGSCQKIPRRQ